MPVGAAYLYRRADQRAAYPQLVSGTPLDGGLPVWPEFDNFTDSDGVDLSVHVPNTGGAWVVDSVMGGDAVITNANRVRQNSSVNSVWTINQTAPNPSYYVQCTIYGFSLLIHEYGTGVAGRWQGAGSGYVAYYSPNGQQWVLTYIVGGVPSGTPLGLFNQTISLTTSYTLILRL